MAKYLKYRFSADIQILINGIERGERACLAHEMIFKTSGIQIDYYQVWTTNKNSSFFVSNCHNYIEQIIDKITLDDAFIMIRYVNYQDPVYRLCYDKFGKPYRDQYIAINWSKSNHIPDINSPEVKCAIRRAILAGKFNPDEWHPWSNKYTALDLIGPSNK